MKTQIIDIKGAKKGDIELPAVFSAPIREDIVSKVAEVEKFDIQQPYSLSPTAGRRHSASGTISHRRHEWKGHYGKGIARVPRKAMWRRGTQFYWIGAEVNSTRGGRRVHGPSGVRTERKINDKEFRLALASAIASTASQKHIIQRYSTLKGTKSLKLNFPLVIDSMEKAKVKDILAMLQTTLGDLYTLAIQNKEVRSGLGKRRGRRYKSNAGLLLVTAKLEKVKIKGIDVKSVKELKVLDIYPLGRLTMFTQKALEEIKNVA